MRALNAVKLERVFAKPFIGNLDGHRDAISCLKKHPNKLALLASGDFNGEVRTKSFNPFRFSLYIVFSNFIRPNSSKIDSPCLKYRGKNGIFKGLTKFL